MMGRRLGDRERFWKWAIPNLILGSELPGDTTQPGRIITSRWET
jgi:hypothetical protein